jgi:HD-GYP domain-containing protein (c-di-GMP phosphodiesterase class II)
LKEKVRAYPSDTAISPLRLVFQFIQLLERLVPALGDHHMRVAILSWAVATNMGLGSLTVKVLVRASLVHDLGMFLSNPWWDDEPHEDHEDEAAIDYWESISALEGLQEELSQRGGIPRHARTGYDLIRRLPPLEKLAPLILLHHHPYRILKDLDLEEEKKTAAAIMNACDRLAGAFLLKEDGPLSRKRILKMLASLAASGELDPNAVSVLQKLLEKRDHLWSSMTYPNWWQRELLSIADEVVFLSLDELSHFMETLSQVIDAKSPFTKKHTLHVVQTAVFLGKEMGLTEREIKTLRLAAFMHDLGKIATPNAILHKAHSLTPEEWTLMRQHVYLSYLLFKDFDKLNDVAFVAATHHERLDGSGYPWGVSGDQLTLLSLILQVADIYAAMREDRPYRKGFPHEKATESLKKSASEGKISGAAVEALVRSKALQGLSFDLETIPLKTYCDVSPEQMAISELEHPANAKGPDSDPLLGLPPTASSLLTKPCCPSPLKAQ